MYRKFPQTENVSTPTPTAMAAAKPETSAKFKRIKFNLHQSQFPTVDKGLLLGRIGCRNFSTHNHRIQLIHYIGKGNAAAMTAG